MNLIVKLIAVIATIAPACTFAAHPISPWYGRLWEAEATTSYSYASFDQIKSGRETIESKAENHLVDFDLATMAWPDLNIAASIQLANTKRNELGIVTLGFTGEYLWLDDVARDAISLSTGFSLFSHPSKAKNDPHLFVLSNAQLQLHLSLGKEISRGEEWSWRFWQNTFATVANRGSPSLGIALGAQMRFWENHALAMEMIGWKGFGKRNFPAVNAFSGYASIDYCTLDAEAKYTYYMPVWGRISLGYMRTIAVSNAPQSRKTFSCSYTLPFGI
ncbi:hypothetical protein JYU14_04355 [Simkania negevensis]|uniref:Uncharacterized protein n=1 Tax=Simkania negevensis TaxID=83561 RepID=A0ABS3ARD1_9BACT|nr:hypothetical protein [Simkania negevensis]